MLLLFNEFYAELLIFVQSLRYSDEHIRDSLEDKISTRLYLALCASPERKGSLDDVVSFLTEMDNAHNSVKKLKLETRGDKLKKLSRNIGFAFATLRTPTVNITGNNITSAKPKVRSVGPCYICNDYGYQAKDHSRDANAKSLPPPAKNQIKVNEIVPDDDIENVKEDLIFDTKSEN